MKGITLDVYQFYLFNYEDWLKLFEEQKKVIIAQMSETERNNFNPYHFDYKETQKLFKEFKKLTIFPDDTLWGMKGDKHVFIDFSEGVYQCALSYFNKDLMI